MVLCINLPQSLLSTISDISIIVIALTNLLLAFYVFIYRRNKDREDEERNRVLLQQSINLQWFKDLIIQPNLNDIFKFYKNTRKVSEDLLDKNITEDEKLKISDKIKREYGELKKSFVDILKSVDSEFQADIKENLEKLQDELITAIFNEGINLYDKPTFEREINSKITYSENDLIGRIYKYKGA